MELSFREGVVVSARADRGDDVLQAMLATDDGARRLGEIGIGTNFGIDRPVGMTLLDEKIGGTVHLALGRSYPETGGTNESAIHWDLICDLRNGGRLTADDTPILVDGRLVSAHRRRPMATSGVADPTRAREAPRWLGRPRGPTLLSMAVPAAVTAPAQTPAARVRGSPATRCTCCSASAWRSSR